MISDRSLDLDLTLAQWTAREEVRRGRLYLSVFDKDGNHVADVNKHLVGVEGANLLATAPELLLASRAAEQLIESMPDPHPHVANYRATLKMLRQVIAKAMSQNVALGNLIDAAPDMLEACQKALDAFGDRQINDANKNDPETAKAFDAILHLAAAIAKATGQEATSNG